MDGAKKKKLKRIIFKVDFAKAYDSTDWDILDDMMRGMNFSPKWRGWVREYISSASISVLVNGCPTEDFKLETGLRQGDPLSPFLFLIAAEGMSLLIKKKLYT